VLLGTGWLKVGIAIFFTASIVSYARAVPVFKATHDDNDWLAAVYDPHRQSTALDLRAFPNRRSFDIDQSFVACELVPTGLFLS
jgi:hypothetical protein